MPVNKLKCIDSQEIEGKSPIDWEPNKNTRICSAHFVNNRKSEHPLYPSYLPSIFPEKVNDIKSIQSLQRFERSRVRQSRKTINYSVCNLDNCGVPGCDDKYSTRHRYPNPNKDMDRFKQWIYVVNNPKLVEMDPERVYRSYRVCHLHFTAGDSTTNMYLSRTSLPSQKLPPRLHSETRQPVVLLRSARNDSTKTQEAVSSQEILNCDSRGLQSTKETSENRRPDAITVTTLQQEAYVSGDVANESEQTLDGCESTTVPDQDVESEHVEIVSERQPDAFDVPTEQRQAVKSKDASSKLGTFFSEFGDELKCRTCMQFTYDGLPLDAPCFTTRSIKDAITQLLPELVPYLEHEDVICPNCLNKFNAIFKFLENCLRVNNSLAYLADKKNLHSLDEQNNEKPLVLEDDDSFDDMFEDGGKSMDIEKQNEVVAKKGIKPVPKRCFIYSTFLTIPNNDNVVSFNGIESDKSLELAQTFTDLGIRVADESKGNGKKRIVLIGNNNIWMCPICRMAFRIESELHRHAVEVHNLLKAHLLTPKTYFNENSGNSEKCKVFNCPYCDESVLMNSLVEHTIEMHGDPKPFKCFNCRKVFGSYKWYKRHNNALYRHPLDKTVCKICDKRIKWESYKDHFDSHKTFHCEFCDKCFTNKTSLRTHEATHKGESTLCPFCGKTFSIQGLKIHVKRVHEEQTKGELLCHICSKTLCTPKALARHIDSVHNAKQVGCKLCGKIFRSNISLQYHLRCNVCSIRFGCPFCKREFIRKKRLKMHMIKNHNSANVCESEIIRRRIRPDDVGAVENTENEPNIINDLDENVGMNMEIES